MEDALAVAIQTSTMYELIDFYRHGTYCTSSYHVNLAVETGNLQVFKIVYDEWKKFLREHPDNHENTIEDWDMHVFRNSMRDLDIFKVFYYDRYKDKIKDNICFLERRASDNKEMFPVFDFLCTEGHIKFPNKHLVSNAIVAGNVDFLQHLRQKKYDVHISDECIKNAQNNRDKYERKQLIIDHVLNGPVFFVFEIMMAFPLVSIMWFTSFMQSLNLKKETEDAIIVGVVSFCFVGLVLP